MKFRGDPLLIQYRNEHGLCETDWTTLIEYSPNGKKLKLRRGWRVVEYLLSRGTLGKFLEEDKYGNKFLEVADIYEKDDTNIIEPWVEIKNKSLLAKNELAVHKLESIYSREIANANQEIMNERKKRLEAGRKLTKELNEQQTMIDKVNIDSITMPRKLVATYLAGKVGTVDLEHIKSTVVDKLLQDTKGSFIEVIESLDKRIELVGVSLKQFSKQFVPVINAMANKLNIKPVKVIEQS